MTSPRPRPPEELLGLEGALAPMFAPAVDLRGWAFRTFIKPDAPLYNEDHSHLVAARVAFLWTSAPAERYGRTIAGQCEFRPPGGSMGKWARARAQAQLGGWFGELPDFLLTFFAPYAAACSDDEFCALVEHELYHAGQAKDEFGAPAFSKDGMPVFALRGHDVEEFTGIVRRYGADAAHVRAFIAAAEQGPEIAAVHIAGACGNCLKFAA